MLDSQVNNNYRLPLRRQLRRQQQLTSRVNVTSCWLLLAHCLLTYFSGISQQASQQASRQLEKGQTESCYHGK